MSALRKRAVVALQNRRTQTLDPATLQVAESILEDIQNQGTPAIRNYAEQFDGLSPTQPMVLDRACLAAAAARLSQQQLALLKRVAARIRTFATTQKQALSTMSMQIEGIQAGHEITPIQRAGCYAPGGRYPLPSSILMTAVTARVAGVSEVMVASPKPSDIMLAAAFVADADCFVAVGGAQAIGALAYGIENLPACDVVVGPGNRYVTAAKQIISRSVGIDMLAGPSELVVIADESAKPKVVAADLIAVAEHDPDSLPVLLTTSRSLLERVQQAVDIQLHQLPTADVARAAFTNGGVVLCTDLQHMAEVSDQLAPEHLSLHLREPETFRKCVQHYGALFVGEVCAEVLGDYGAGPNHVLPTQCSARYAAGLSVFTFLRIRSWMRCVTPASAQAIIQDAVDLATLEGLEGHAQSARLRLESHSLGF